MATGSVNLNCARIEKPDLAAIDQLARIRLELGRCGCGLRLQHATDELVALIELAGLGAVLRVEMKRKAEEREQPCRVEEEGELGDPAAS